MNRWTPRIMMALNAVIVLLLLYVITVQSHRVTAVEAQNAMLLEALDRITRAQAAQR